MDWLSPLQDSSQNAIRAEFSCEVEPGKDLLPSSHSCQHCSVPGGLPG